MYKQSLKALFKILIILAVLNSNINSAWALGDDHYHWLESNYTFINNNYLVGTLKIGCNTHCFWDRVINVIKDTESVKLENADYFEINDFKLHAIKLNDYKVLISGPVVIITKHKYSAHDADIKGLLDAGFKADSNDKYASYYFAIINVNKEFQP
jgi:hypothetical protein